MKEEDLKKALACAGRAAADAATVFTLEMCGQYRQGEGKPEKQPKKMPMAEPVEMEGWKLSAPKSWGEPTPAGPVWVWRSELQGAMFGIDDAADPPSSLDAWIARRRAVLSRFTEGWLLCGFREVGSGEFESLELNALLAKRTVRLRRSRFEDELEIYLTLDTSGAFPSMAELAASWATLQRA